MKDANKFEDGVSMFWQTVVIDTREWQKFLLA